MAPAEIERGRATGSTGFLVAAGLLAIVSLVPRMAQLDLPILEKNDFRQTQTALTAQVFSDSGIEFLEYQTPIFGPPWMVPFELPIFQAGVAVVSWLLPEGTNLDIACRLTALISFYLSALALYVACREALDRWYSGWIVAVYLMMPFNLVYSRLCLIDFTSVAFALLYLVAVLKWLRSDRPFAWAVISAGVGSIAATVKITTIPIILPAAVLMCVWAFLWRGRGDQTGQRPTVRGLAWSRIFQLGILTAVPVLIEWLWLWHTDAIKQLSPFTSWLTSEHLRHWNWGTLQQRFHIESWMQIAQRIEGLITPGWTAVLPVATLAALLKIEAKGRVFIASLAFGGALPVLMFFNLYVVHEYYLIAITAPIAVVAGTGLGFVMRRRRGAVILLQVVAAGLMAVSLHRAYRVEVLPYLVPPPHRATVLSVAALIRDGTALNDPVVMTQPHGDWSSRIPYYAHRRFLVLRNKSEEPWIDEFMITNGFSYGVLHRSNPLRLANWNKTLIGSAGEYQLFELAFAGDSNVASSNLENRPSERTLVLTSESEGFATSLVAVHEVGISEDSRGILLDARGYDPVLLLPDFRIPRECRISLRIVLDSPADTELRVYYMTPSSPEYTEELRESTIIRRGTNDVVIEIFHPEVRGNLRLDPGTAPGQYVLRSLEVWIHSRSFE